MLIDRWDNRAAAFFTAFTFALGTLSTNVSQFLERRERYDRAVPALFQHSAWAGYLRLGRRMGTLSVGNTRGALPRVFDSTGPIHITVGDRIFVENSSAQYPSHRV